MAVYPGGHQLFVAITLRSWTDDEDEIEDLLKHDRLRLVAVTGETDWILSLKTGHVTSKTKLCPEMPA
jgi:hypothetical protein